MPSITITKFSVDRLETVRQLLWPKLEERKKTRGLSAGAKGILLALHHSSGSKGHNCTLDLSRRVSAEKGVNMAVEVPSFLYTVYKAALQFLGISPAHEDSLVPSMIEQLIDNLLLDITKSTTLKVLCHVPMSTRTEMDNGIQNILSRACALMEETNAGQIRYDTIQQLSATPAIPLPPVTIERPEQDSWVPGCSPVEQQQEAPRKKSGPSVGTQGGCKDAAVPPTDAAGKVKCPNGASGSDEKQQQAKGVQGGRLGTIHGLSPMQIATPGKADVTNPFLKPADVKTLQLRHFFLSEVVRTAKDAKKKENALRAMEQVKEAIVRAKVTERERMQWKQNGHQLSPGTSGRELVLTADSILPPTDAENFLVAESIALGTGAPSPRPVQAEVSPLMLPAMAMSPMAAVPLMPLDSRMPPMAESLQQPPQAASARAPGEATGAEGDQAAVSDSSSEDEDLQVTAEQAVEEEEESDEDSEDESDESESESEDGMGSSGLGSVISVPLPPVKRPRGRPPKNPQGVKRPRGRPPKNPQGVKRPRGRPPKNPQGPPRPRGRPPKNPQGPPRPRGRPRKAASTETHSPQYVTGGKGLMAITLIGKRVRAYWEAEGRWFKGTIVQFNPGKNQHVIRYDDGEKEDVQLPDDTIEFVEE